MAKKEWNDPTNSDNIKVTVTTITPMAEIKKGNLKTTGKEEQGKSYNKEYILSTDLMNGDVASIKVDKEIEDKKITDKGRND